MSICFDLLNEMCLANLLLYLVYARQFVEIALANLIINPTSNKVQQKFGGGQQKPGAGQGMNKPAGGRARLGASATAPSGGRGRR